MKEVVDDVDGEEEVSPVACAVFVAAFAADPVSPETSLRRAVKSFPAFYLSRTPP